MNALLHDLSHKVGPPRERAPFTFYLGSNNAAWLKREAFRGIPLFISRRTLAGRKRLPRAITRWAVDSGGFTELKMHGRWTVTAAEYVRDLARFDVEIGSVDWSAPQDWMCEPEMLERTGLTIPEHQRRTVASVQELRALGARVIPVLQGWKLADYLRCVEDYDRAGIDLRDEPIVGLGSVCRRHATDEAAVIVRRLFALGIRVHGFGFKSDGVRKCHDALASSDSMAWSLGARRAAARKTGPRPGEMYPGHQALHRSCSHCADWALLWRETLLSTLGRPVQIPLLGDFT